MQPINKKNGLFIEEWILDTQRDELDGIAIIGMSGRFPGAKSVEQFWQNLIAGVDCISKFSEGELEFSVLTPESKARGKRSEAARGAYWKMSISSTPLSLEFILKKRNSWTRNNRIFLECCMGISRIGRLQPSNLSWHDRCFRGFEP